MGAVLDSQGRIDAILTVGTGLTIILLPHVMQKQPEFQFGRRRGGCDDPVPAYRIVVALSACRH